MGYYGNYKVSVVNKESCDFKQVLERISVLSGYTFKDNGRTYFKHVQWQDHHTDMLKLSWEFHDTISALHGVEEVKWKYWVTYYYRGSLYTNRCKDIHNEFNKELLS